MGKDLILRQNRSRTRLQTAVQQITTAGSIETQGNRTILNVPETLLLVALEMSEARVRKVRIPEQIEVQAVPLAATENKIRS